MDRVEVILKSGASIFLGDSHAGPPGRPLTNYKSVLEAVTANLKEDAWLTTPIGWIRVSEIAAVLERGEQ